MITAVGTDIGRVREINEDAFSVRRIDHDSYCMIVADGMGGHKAGETASRRACSIIGDRICAELTDGSWEGDRVLEVMQESISVANKTLYSAQLTDSELAGMGTTVVAVVVRGNKAFVCNVGDSRLYLYSDGLKQITKDHSYVAELLEMGVITEKQAAVHPNKNVITRAIGTEKSVVPDTYSGVLKKDDVILICSDGLSNMVSDKDISDVIKKAEKAETAASMLVELANKNGGRDNITAVVMKYDETGRDKAL